MLWPFKSFFTFTFHTSRARVRSLSNQIQNQGGSDAEHPKSVSHPADIKFTTAELKHASQLCQCGNKQLEFCPYCEYDQALQVEGSALMENRLSSNIDGPVEYSQMDGSDGPSRPRKLRKIKSDYSRIQPIVLDEESGLSLARPNSLLSNNSRTLLLQNQMEPKCNYLPLPSEHRTPRKLEKRGRERTSSLPNVLYSTFSDVSNHQRPIKTVKSKSFLNKSKSVTSFGPRPNPISKSIETDALVALAWTGHTSPVLSQVSTPDSDDPLSFGYVSSSSLLVSPNASKSEAQISPESSTVSSGSKFPDNKHRSVLRKPKDSTPAAPRPWTLAMVITDDGITDEKLVDDLEHMRIKDPTVDISIIPDRYPFFQEFTSDHYHSQLYESLAEYPLQYGEAVPDPISPSDSSWTSARQALLLCRELVRTERRYLSSLKVLITNGTNTPPPSQMLSYLPGLIAASDSLLTLMEENPSVQGVSQAFLVCNDQMGDAFVNWCAVVGQFFDSDDGSKKKSIQEESSDTHVKHNPFPALPNRGLSAESVLPIVVTEPNKIRKNSKSRPSVRDLAILPTQRIMRYVLLFKELRALTPTSYFSSSFVDLAVQAAESIAQSADMAQGHTAFVPPNY